MPDIRAFVQQAGEDLGRCLVPKALQAQYVRAPAGGRGRGSGRALEHEPSNARPWAQGTRRNVLKTQGTVNQHRTNSGRKSCPDGRLRGSPGLE
jgi:hypothetical protein